MNFYIYYHGDNDGVAAGFWAYDEISHFAEILNIDSNIELYKINYNMEFNTDIFAEDDVVVFVDFSIPPEKMEELYSITKSVIWIDHHISAINKYYTYKDGYLINNVPGIRVDGVAGCCLSWMYFKHLGSDITGIRDIICNNHDNKHYVLNITDTTESDKLRKGIYKHGPIINNHIGDNDIWKFELENTRDIISDIGFLSLSDNGLIETEYLLKMVKLNSDTYKNSIMRGKAINDYKRQLYSQMCKSSGECKLIANDEYISSLRCVALNASCCNSDVFDSLNEEYDIYIKFNLLPSGEYLYTFYSKNTNRIDASRVAQYYGGGGHKGAAGTHAPHLIFEWVAKERNSDE
jgi:oligoribonuclease NrnB/cAMP/cGMP phosphodiesterase (DHH superfamily)